MAPNGTLPKRKANRSENQYLFNLGEKGRKTGLTLPDTGIRDENGLEPMDNLFSSPMKPKGRSKKGDSVRKNANTTISTEEDMDVGTIPEPELLLEKRASLRLPPPRSKSPVKTFLNSPARRNPSMGPVSSPTRGSIIAPRSASVTASVRRKLDFSNTSDDGSSENIIAAKRAGSALPVVGRLTNGTHLKPLKQPLSSDNASPEGSHTADVAAENDEDSLQLVNGASEDDYEIAEVEDDAVPQDEEADENEEQEAETKSAKKGKRKSSELVALVQPVKKGRGGRPKRADAIQAEEQQEDDSQEELQEERPAKRPRKSLDTVPKVTKKGGRPRKTIEAVEPEELGKKAAGRPRKGGEASTASKARGKASKPKLAAISEEDSPAVKRGPPMPRNNRGLVILRRETPAEGTGFKQTRSGRNSIKPLAFWRNERVEYSEDENEDGYGKFLLPRIKEVVRTDEIEGPKRRRPTYRSKSSKPKKRAEPESEDEEAEPWEVEPGRIVGEIRMWDPEDQTGQNADPEEQEIAFSSAAILTQVVKDGSFKFAKTLTLPFFGSGMLDLRPGDKKKAKYSRKMQMVFFVHYGRVQVTVNGDNTFRIGKGGMWQVPRGNLYSIENDYDQPARIFFAQGCDLTEEEAIQ